jgi:glycerol-3-phosphate dehydrogenase
LTEIINEKHENVKYLPGIKLPKNIVAVSDAVEAASGADLLIFVLPHQVSKCRWRSLDHLNVLSLSESSLSRAFAKLSKARSAKRLMPSP